MKSKRKHALWTVLRLSGILLIVLGAAVITGFADSGPRDHQTVQLEQLLAKRTCVMQRFMFGQQKKPEELFCLLAEFENYPLLAEDFRAAAEAGDSDYEKIINMKLLEAECLEYRSACGLYRVTIRWYLSGCGGYRSETGSYRVRTDIVNHSQRLAEIQVLDEG